MPGAMAGGVASTGGGGVGVITLPGGGVGFRNTPGGGADGLTRPGGGGGNTGPGLVRIGPSEPMNSPPGYPSNPGIVGGQVSHFGPQPGRRGWSAQPQTSPRTPETAKDAQRARTMDVFLCWMGPKGNRTALRMEQSSPPKKGGSGDSIMRQENGEGKPASGKKKAHGCYPVGLLGF